MDKVVAIDGPSGSGKSSIAKEVAKDLGLVYVDTGAMYRAIGYHLNSKKINLSLVPELNAELIKMNFRYAKDPVTLVEIDGIDLTAKIREHVVSEMASYVSQIKEVREYLTKIQRELVNQKICVMEGRDIGTVVFPNSFCKIYLTANSKVRAQRRFDQLDKMGQLKQNLETILRDIEARDRRDTSRTEAPLKQAPDAVFLDTSELDFKQVKEAVKKIVKDKAMLAHLII